MTKRILCAIACALALGACKGSDGSRGEVGPTGPTGPTGPAPRASKAWKFGIIADTQWPASKDDGQNPNSVAVGIINQVNAEFVRQGVELVVAVGDVTDTGCSATPCPQLETRALFAQALYDNGIGFYPLRGNHESQAVAASEFVRLFPQTQNGLNNMSPPDAFAVSLGGDALSRPAQSGAPFLVGSNFSSPTGATGHEDALKGLSYSFDYRNARFVLLDQFMGLDGAVTTDAAPSIAAQQPWISSTLGGRTAGTHAFVFAHKGLVTDDHEDGLFGENPSQNAPQMDAFIQSLQQNKVHFLVGGHDHMHLHEIISTVDGKASVHELVTQSDSYKFYTPQGGPDQSATSTTLSNDNEFDVANLGVARQQRIGEEIWHVGYYVVTVDEGNVTVDYYAVPIGLSSVPVSGSAAPNMTVTPTLTGRWEKHDSFGYGLGGKEFLVAQGQPYTAVVDSHGTTAAKILAGVNGSTLKDPLGTAAYVKAVDTGWAAGDAGTLSDAFTLWGLADVDSDVADTYALSLGFAGGTADELASGEVGLARLDERGLWVNAVSANAGGAEAFVARAWKQGDALGTYGVDPATHTAWAVLNRTGTFAVARFQ